MNRIRASIIFTLLIMTSLKAQNIAILWPENPPTSNEISDLEITDRNYKITNVSSPMLTIYLPDKAINTGMAVIICPGGGYAGLASMHEGTQVAQWLQQKGIAAFVLKYRMPNGHKEVPLDDAWQAIRFVRDNAADYDIKPWKIGIAGFSAGGHLASTASTHYATKGTITRPDFSILFYPVITMSESAHKGSRKNLLGENPSSIDIELFSNEKHINAETPPTILLLSDDDKSVPPTNSIDYYKGLKKNGVPAAMYIFPEGGHGWGMRKNFKYHDQMLSLLEKWLADTNITLDGQN